MGKEQKKRGRKIGSTNKKKEHAVGINQSVMERFTQAARNQAATEVAHNGAVSRPEEPDLEEDPNQSRRKRRKTASPPPAKGLIGVVDDQASQSLDWHQQLELEAHRPTESQTISIASELDTSKATTNTPLIGVSMNDRPVTPLNGATVDSKQGDLPSSITGPATSKDTTKKKIKISRSGRLVSSPPVEELEAIPPKKRRARKPKLKAVPTVTVIRYGQDAESRRVIGGKIDAIFNGEKRVQQAVAPKKIPPKPSGPPKPTHPFFLGKPGPRNNEVITNEQPSDTQPSPSPRAQKRSAVTPGKLKIESQSYHSSIDQPPFGSNSSRPTKQSGFIEAPWPAKEMAHVRDLDVNESSLPSQQQSLKARKFKNNVTSVSNEEDLISNLASQLRPLMQKCHNANLPERTSSEALRLPTRLLTSGIDIQERLRTQIVSMSRSREQPNGVHPAIPALFSSIQEDLTAFDLGKCEPLSWVQKYAPKYASHVLQVGNEPAILKDWLQSLTVLAVSGNIAETSFSKKPPKKKRKTIQDDFVVDSDDEEEEELIEIRREDVDNHGVIQMPLSLRRARWTRNKNVVLISGPHGCGKSAMVQAVAKDLGFEIFEINSGSRRSGRDIQDKVGDMTANHLVSHKRSEKVIKPDAASADNTDTERHSDALRKDLDSGRQGTMMSFFKSKTTVASQSKVQPREGNEPARKVPPSGQATLPVAQSQRKSQKQSLILLEEADVLYEEDQGFWAQVTKLASQSKRPIIITCTNENLIPMHELPLAAILRVSAPPISLATDYMIVMAGHEGHILQRDAVSTLYRSKDYDLRASITELNFWCQMSVGDKKGGLEWIYQRWPPGKDVDESGQPLRVASEGTYLPGMGCLSHDLFSTRDHIGFDRTKELLKGTWEEWDINPNEWTVHYGIASESHAQGRGRIDELKRFETIIDSTSAADIFCRTDMPTYKTFFEQPTDPSMPRMSEKARLGHTLAAPVLQVDHTNDFSHFDTDMLTQMHLQIQRAYGGSQTSDAGQAMSIPKTEQGFASAILQHKNRQACESHLSWPDFSHAFDILAYLPDNLPALNTSYNLTPSSFDRTFRIVVEDLAPYVRSIVASEIVLENQRIRLGNLLSEGGSRSNKRQRTTRAARTALEGGSRDTKRRERWFDADLNRTLVMDTAGRGWAGMGFGCEVDADSDSRTEGSAPSATSTQEY